MPDNNLGDGLPICRQCGWRARTVLSELCPECGLKLLFPDHGWLPVYVPDDYEPPHIDRRIGEAPSPYSGPERRRRP